MFKSYLYDEKGKKLPHKERKKIKGTVFEYNSSMKKRKRNEKRGRKTNVQKTY